MRIAALAALLAVAHGTAGPAAAARADWNDNGGPGFGGAATGGSMTASDRRELGPVAQASRALVSEGRDRQCGCNSRDPGNGHASRAGF